MRKKSAFFQIIPLVAAGLILTACLASCGAAQTPPEQPESAPSAPTENASLIRVGSVTEIDSMDPHVSVSAGARELLFNIFEGLIKPDEHGNMQPAIAREFSISADAKTYSFTLRDGVRFHDGAEVTAEDVEHSLRRAMEETDGQLVHAAFEEISEINLLDKSRIDVVLRSPNTEFLPQLTIAAIIPKNNSDPESAPIGTGPYRYVSRTKEAVTLERFERYWGTPAYIEKAEWKIYPDVNAIKAALEADEIDAAFQLPYDMAENLPSEYRVYEASMNLVQGLYLNNDFPPFSDVRVRQALCYATDKQALFQEAFHGYGTAIGGPMYPAFGKYYMPELNDLYPTNLEKAAALLTEAGYPDGFSFTITAPSNYVQHVDTAKCLAKQYAHIGLDVSVKEVEWAEWLSGVYMNREHEATVIGVDATTLSGSALLSLYASDATNNFINFRSDAYDEAYRKAVETVDDAEKTKRIKDCERILAEEAASVFLQDPADFSALRADFVGYVFYPMPAQNLARIRPAE